MSVDHVVLLVSNVIVNGLIIFFGFLLYKHPPNFVNIVYGYRTKRSMASEEAWDFAQRYAGKLMFYWGLISLVISSLGIYFTYSINEWLDTGFMMLCAPGFIFIICKTEKQLKKKFDK